MFSRRPPAGALLVENTAEAWAEALERLTADERLRARLGVEGRAWAERHYDGRASYARLAAAVDP
jgi:glycosyltransferase involved in cell wall biosynthesis